MDEIEESKGTGKEKVQGKKTPRKRGSRKRGGDSNKEGEQEKKKKRYNPRKATASYASYIYKVLKQIHPDVGMTMKAMLTMQSIVLDVFSKLSSKALEIARYNKRSTVIHRDIEGAVKLLYPGQLATHCVGEIKGALKKWSQDK